MTRILILSLALLPYLYYGTKDNVFHFRGRKVTAVEHLLHLAIGITLAGAIYHAYGGRIVNMVGCMLMFLVSGGIDEYVFHRRLPEHESDLHAKGHMALLLFVMVAISTQWLAARGWALTVR
jgi:hypothetical protein